MFYEYYFLLKKLFPYSIRTKCLMRCFLRARLFKPISSEEQWFLQDI